MARSKSASRVAADCTGSTSNAGDQSGWMSWAGWCDASPMMRPPSEPVDDADGDVSRRVPGRRHEHEMLVERGLALDEADAACVAKGFNALPQVVVSRRLEPLRRHPVVPFRLLNDKLRLWEEDLASPAVEVDGVPADVVDVQVGMDHEVDVARVHPCAPEGLVKPAHGEARPPPRAEPGVDEQGPARGTDEVAGDAHGEQPALIRLGTELVVEAVGMLRQEVARVHEDRCVEQRCNGD